MKKVFVIELYSQTSKAWVRSLDDRNEYTSLKKAETAAKDLEKVSELFGLKYRGVGLKYRAVKK